MNESLKVTIDDLGRVGIPHVFREQTNLKPGDKLLISLEGNSIVMLLPEKEVDQSV